MHERERKKEGTNRLRFISQNAKSVATYA